MLFREDSRVSSLVAVLAAGIAGLLAASGRIRGLHPAAWAPFTGLALAGFADSTP